MPKPLPALLQPSYFLKLTDLLLHRIQRRRSSPRVPPSRPHQPSRQEPRLRGEYHHVPGKRPCSPTTNDGLATLLALTFWALAASHSLTFSLPFTQRVSAAYERIQQHHTKPEPRAFPGGGGGGGGMGNFNFSSGFGRPSYGGGFSSFTSPSGFTFFGPGFRPGMAGGQFDQDYARSRGGGGGGGGYYQDSEDEYDEEDDYSDEDDDEDYGRGPGGNDFFSFM